MSEKFIKFCPVCQEYFTDADKYARHVARHKGQLFSELPKRNVAPDEPVKAEEDSDSVENDMDEPEEPVVEKKRLGRPPKFPAK